MAKRLPDEIWLQRQKQQNKKAAQRKQKIIDYIEKYHQKHSRCSLCDRKGTVSALTRESVKVRCVKCKKEWLFKKKFSRAFLPNSLFLKSKKQPKQKKPKKITSKVKPLTKKQIAKKNKEKKKLEKKIFEILKGNIEINLSSH